MNLWRKIFFIILICILLLLGVLTCLVSTPKGLRLIFNTVNYWIPWLRVGQITGKLQDLHLKNIRYDHLGILVTVGELHLVTKLSKLSKNVFCFDDLLLKDLNVIINSKNILNLKKIKKNSDSNRFNFLSSYQLVINHIKLNNVNIKLGDTLISLKNFTSSLNWKDRNLTLKSAFLQRLVVFIPVKVTELKMKNLNTNSKTLKENLSQFISKSFLFKIKNISLPLNINIEELKGEHLHLISNVNFIIHSFLLRASNVSDNIFINMLNIHSSKGIVSVSGFLWLHNSWPISINLNSTLNINDLQKEYLKIQVSGELRRKTMIEINLSGFFDLKLNAQLQLEKVGLPMDINLVSKHFFWPFVGKKQYQIKDFTMKFRGKITNYNFYLRTLIKKQKFPSAAIILNINKNRQTILNKLTINILKGIIELNTLINWQQRIRWSGELNFSNINTIKEISNWPLKLTGFIKTSGSFYKGNWLIDVAKLKINGISNLNKLNVNGLIKRTDYMQWSIQDLNINLGSNNIDIKGDLGTKNLKLDAFINLPNLKQIVPRLNGVIKGLAKIRGTIKIPKLLTNVTAVRIHWRKLSLAFLHINSSVKFTDRIIGNLKLNVKQFTQLDTNLSSVILNIEGNEEQHNVQLHVQGTPVSGQIQITGSFNRDKQHWIGQLSNTYFNTPIGQWIVNKPIRLYYLNIEKRINVESHCWNNVNAKLCLNHPAIIGTKGNVSVNLNYFNIDMLKIFIPDAIRTSGVFDSKIDIAWDFSKKRLPQAKLIVSGHNIQIIRMINGIAVPVIFSSINARANTYNSYANFNWIIKFTDKSRFNGYINIINSKIRRKIHGKVNFYNFNLNKLNIILPYKGEITGILNAQIKFIKNAKTPKIFGKIQFNNLNINDNLILFDMQPSKLLIKLNGVYSTLYGILNTRQGKLNFRGGANWGQINNWSMYVNGKGNLVHISVLPMVHLDISPNLSFKATSKLLTLDGYIDVLRARILLQKLPENALYMSNDEVMLDKDLKSIKNNNKNIHINSNVVVHVGNNVQIDAFGLKAKLFGNIKIVNTNQGLILSGKISIPEGRFHAYGQNLIVRKGELVFSGLPNKPIINIEAIRDPETTENNIIVGIRIVGIADKPKVEIFSDLEISQQEAISYLLYGQGIKSGYRDSTAMSSILLRLGIVQSDQIINKIGKLFGLNNLSLAGQGVGNSSQLVISGYILPDLQVKYGVGIFDSLDNLKLRYRLMPKLYLEIIYGINQALDLLYQFEF